MDCVGSIPSLNIYVESIWSLGWRAGRLGEVSALPVLSDVKHFSKFSFPWIQCFGAFGVVHFCQQGDCGHNFLSHIHIAGQSTSNQENGSHYRQKWQLLPRRGMSVYTADLPQSLPEIFLVQKVIKDQSCRCCKLTNLQSELSGMDKKARQEFWQSCSSNLLSGKSWG